MFILPNTDNFFIVPDKDSRIVFRSSYFVLIDTISLSESAAENITDIGIVTKPEMFSL
jgi:hypothetical protein